MSQQCILTAVVDSHDIENATCRHRKCTKPSDWKPHRNSIAKSFWNERHRLRRLCALSSMSQGATEEKELLEQEVGQWTVEYRCSLMRDDEDVAVD